MTPRSLLNLQDTALFDKRFLKSHNIGTYMHRTILCVVSSVHLGSSISSKRLAAFIHLLKVALMSCNYFCATTENFVENSIETPWRRASPNESSSSRRKAWKSATKLRTKQNGLHLTSEICCHAKQSFIFFNVRLYDQITMSVYRIFQKKRRKKHTACLSFCPLSHSKNLSHL